MKPKFIGPYTIVGLDKNGSSAIIEKLTTGRTMKAHFTNLQLFSYHPDFAKLPDNFEEVLWKDLPEKYSNDRYYPKPGRQQLNEMDNFDTDDEYEEYSEEEEYFEVSRGGVQIL
jgi:hypothetical protein